ncbi:TRP-domain-containing protein [Setomelanomma holmii]|uniref:TRP-domain-containing protein n=1 Tax=Setomelanomma holmii TaxID=210430 RepID=A0A9P4HK68_9PLEO|nr:TRP-domain-containing protein [Setomelanomma holmii]
MPRTLPRSLYALWLVLLCLASTVVAEEPEYVVATINGQQWRVRDDRQPSLFTGDFGDCLGESVINVTRFDAAYYRDNMTVLFHLQGETALTNESIMMSIGVYAYGENRFELLFNPCNANIDSLCPARANLPIEAQGIIPINENDVSGIPDLALSIPDFEGQAILRLFSNSTQVEIGCFAAQITNGNSFRQKVEVGTVLGLFTLMAAVSSFTTAVYGDDIADMRKHYAHSPSVMMVFAVWHYIYFSGALSLNWPNVLVAFWSNYAWTAGMIYSEHMQNTINNFVGSNKGNTSHVGAAGVGENNPGLGGGYNIHAIYRREIADPYSGFTYTGQPVKPGLPLPGNFSGFAGTLAPDRIPASNAFMTCLLWFLILVGCIVATILVFKVVLEGLSRAKIIRKNRLSFFRAHFVRYAVLAVLRATFIGFFTLAFVSMFQFSYLRSPGPVAVACAVFLLVGLGIGSAAGLACYGRVSKGKHAFEPDRLNIEKTKICKIIPWFAVSRGSEVPRSEDRAYVGSVPWWTLRTAGEKSIHEDERFIKSYGWLASRYRRTRWWFFTVWLVYEFTRASIMAGSSGRPLVQVFGLLGVEAVALLGTVCLRPFEGQRLNVVLVYLLGFSKMATIALSAAFDTHYNLPRIPATVVGIVIIVIQGLLTIVVLLIVAIGAITTFYSDTRNREVIRPRRWMLSRQRYFERINRQAPDIPQPRSVKVKPVQEVQKGPYFSVNQVRRLPKVEDEDIEFLEEIHHGSTRRLSDSSQTQGEDDERPVQRNRSASNQSVASYSALPRAARFHRPSWTSRDFVDARKAGRVRAMSNTSVPTPDGGNRENAARQPSPLSADASRAITPTSSPVPHPYEGEGLSPFRQRARQRSIPSRSSSRPPLETSISEEEVPPIPRKVSKSSIRLVMNTEETE